MAMTMQSLTFDQLIQFTRTSAATYVNSAGLIASAAVDAPRFDYDPATLAPKGLLIESQRTNLLLRSEEFDNASWVKAETTVTANAAVSPDGTADADKLVESSNNTAHHINQSATTTAASHTFSVYMKAAERNFAMLYHVQTTSGAVFNLSTGAITTPSGVTLATGTAVAIGNGWYRCSITVTATAASNNFRIYICSDATTFTYTGDGTSGILIWGAQLEAGSYATSYIPTAGSQVTRTADVASIVAPNFAPWYNQSEGTFVVEVDTAKPTTVDATVLAVDASDGDISNRHYLGFSTGLAEGRTAIGGVIQVSLTQAYAANATEKLAYAYKANDFALARNGSLAGTDASGSLPTIDRMFIGNAAGSAAFLDGHIRSIRYYPTRLSNAQLQALTA
jgi:hypothetical protein